MIWWLDDPQRARSERAGVAVLQEGNAWLADVCWRIEADLTLAVDFDLVLESETVPLTMTFAAFHPFAPPSVSPRGDPLRLSSHQYGSGALCLEYRADNWRDSITGAMMIESAHRLLAAELGDQPRPVPSAHAASLGQTTRGEGLRFVVSQAAAAALSEVPAGHGVDVTLSEKKTADIWTTTVTDLDGVAGLGAWSPFAGTEKRAARAIALPIGTRTPKLEAEAIAALLNEMGLEDDAAALRGPTHVEFMLVDDGKPTLYFAFGASDSRRIFAYRTLAVPTANQRLEAGYEQLRNLSIAIVGCGSLGSKIAVMLARAGLGHFTLVDDDLLFPQNLCRNELSQSGVGAHKVDALKQRLHEVAADVDVKVRRVTLGGQESSATVESVMADLATCDLIVDATADPFCFNYCAAAARIGLKPLVWGEVFAGGIGGLVVRVRPGHEPDPQTARDEIQAWCDARGVPAPPVAGTGRYGGQAGDGQPLIADDAEVSIIAAHLARFALDALTRPDDTAFSAPAYVVGLRCGWIFSEPFETQPIIFSDAASWTVERTAASSNEVAALLSELGLGKKDGDN